MNVTPEIAFGTLTAAVVVGGLIWKAAAKLSSIESKVDQALAWIEEQKIPRVIRISSARKKKIK